MLDDFVTIEKDDLIDNFKVVEGFDLIEDIHSDAFSEIYLDVDNCIKQEDTDDFITKSAVFTPNKSFSLSNTFKSMFSSLYYNTFSSKNKILDLSKQGENKILIFHDLFRIKTGGQGEVEKTKIRNLLKQILLMTYRNNFPNLKQKELGNYSTDCGWGCMLRACQMLLAKALIERKKYIFLKSTDSNLIPINKIEEIKKEVLLLFYDSNISLSKARGSSDYNNFFKNFEIISPKSDEVKEVTPPYSIQMICERMKSAGKWLSDFRVINTFIQINKHFFNSQDSYLYFPSTEIKESEIYNGFGQEMTCKCNPNNFRCVKREGPICNNCIEKMKNEGNKIYFTKGDKIYQFSKGGVIFLLFRLGLNKLEKKYIMLLVCLLIEMRNNIGFVSGKKDRAYYFIGIGSNRFLYLDPHYNQDSVDPEKDDIKSYQIDNVFLFDPNQFTSEFTFGIVINDAKDLKNFVDDILKVSHKFSEDVRLC